MSSARDVKKSIINFLDDLINYKSYITRSKFVWGDKWWGRRLKLILLEEFQLIFLNKNFHLFLYILSSSTFYSLEKTLVDWMAAETSCVFALIISINTFKLLNFRNGENFILSVSMGIESLFNSLTILNRAPKFRRSEKFTILLNTSSYNTFNLRPIVCDSSANQITALLKCTSVKLYSCSILSNISRNFLWFNQFVMRAT